MMPYNMPFPFPMMATPGTMAAPPNNDNELKLLREENEKLKKQVAALKGGDKKHWAVRKVWGAVLKRVFSFLPTPPPKIPRDCGFFRGFSGAALGVTTILRSKFCLIGGRSTRGGDPPGGQAS